MKLLRYILLLFSLITLFNCTTIKEVVKYKESVKIDTVYMRDTIKIIKVIKGDTVRIRGEPIVQKELINTDTLFAFGKYSFAYMYIKNSIPFLDLKEKPIKIDTSIYMNKIKILEKKLIEKSKETTKIKKQPFWSNKWFWNFFIIVSIIIVIFVLKVRGDRF